MYVQEGEETGDTTVFASVGSKDDTSGANDRKNEYHAKSNTDAVGCGW
jgi:hypothetical protein